MEISDIQQLHNSNIEITFACLPDYDDCLKIIVTEDALRQIKKYWEDNLSYGAQLKNKK